MSQHDSRFSNKHYNYDVTYPLNSQFIVTTEMALVAQYYVKDMRIVLQLRPTNIGCIESTGQNNKQ